MSEGSASSSFSFIQHDCNYDVFVSFNPTDRCSDFARNLCFALWKRRIRTFLGDEAITLPDAAQAIRQSRNAVVIFSKNYASSPFCLQQLVQIHDRFRGNGRFIWPVYYHVEPSDVRHGKGSFNVAFDYYEKFFDCEFVERLRSALTYASNLSGGWHVDPSKESYEHEIIEKIIRRISEVVSFIPLHVAEFPVGIESRVKEVCFLLKEHSHNGATMLGIWGMGGAGKSTLARAVYNSIANQFEHLCFLHNVRERSVHDLQNEVLSKTIGDKYRLRSKKVLLILDDIHSSEQLTALAGEPNWFGAGSIIIITTRYKHLLASHRIDIMYEVQTLNKDEARKLLVWNAFRSIEAGPEYDDAIYRAIDYAGGLPLTLEVLGSNLYGLKVHEWESAMDFCKGWPDISYFLKVSYDILEEEHKQLSLDIACFFQGWQLEVATMLWESLGYWSDSCIRALIDKSLVKIDEGGFLNMHGSIQDMGRKIVRKESLLTPGNHIRLWSLEDVRRILVACAESDQFQAIMLDCSYVGGVHWIGGAFVDEKSPKVIIKIYNAKAFGGPKYLPSSFTTTSPSFRLGILRYLNLEGNHYLAELPDLSGASNLEVLSVAHCNNLIKIYGATGHLGNLRALRAGGCTKLISFLEDGINFPLLEILDLTGCSNFEKFPEILGKMEKIKTLALSGTAIETLPESIENLIGLECLYLYNCRRLCQIAVDSIRKLIKLVRLEAGSCGIFNWFKDHEVQGKTNLASWNITRLHLNENNILDQHLAVILRWFPRLQVLELCNNNFTVLPACIEECHSLKRLYLDRCKQLQEIKGIPPNIKVLSAVNCTSLTSVSSKGLLSQIMQAPGNRKFILPGGWVPEWIHCFNSGSSVSLRIRNKFPKIAVYVVFDVKGRGSCRFEFGIRVLINGTHSFVVKTDVLDIESGHIYLFDDPRLLSQKFELTGELQGKKFNNVQISCSTHHKNTSSDAYSYVKYIGVYVYNYGSYADDIQLKNPRRTLEDMICDEDCNFSIYSDSSREDRLYYKDFQASEAPEDSCGGGYSHGVKRSCNGEMGSKQGRNRWHIWLCVIVSSIVLCRCVLHLLWLIHQSLGRFLSFVGYMEP